MKLPSPIKFAGFTLAASAFVSCCIQTPPSRPLSPAASASVNQIQARNDGFTNTPMIPGTPWHLHDSGRPMSPVIAPGDTFSQMAAAPSDAIVLFDGKDLSKWESPNGGAPRWKVENGYMQSVANTSDIRTRETFPDFQLHVEFAEPTPPRGRGQERGNSGIEINGMYEVQVLDSYQNPTYADGQAGALYGQTPPLVNASKPPGEWQTYDIIFENPLWDTNGVLVKKANVTVLHNGVVLHHKRELTGRTDGIGGTPWRTVGTYGKPQPPLAFIELQLHGNLIRYRNIWVRPLGQYDQPLAVKVSSPPATAP